MNNHVFTAPQTETPLHKGWDVTFFVRNGDFIPRN